MVFFTCDSCGESLKKAQIEKHVGMCRGCSCLSCIDCGKDFWGEDYKSHVRCISEDQKYGGRGYEAKANKGDVKQQQWIQRIQEAMSKPGVSSKLKDVLNQVSSYDNVPRKKAKFQNWIKCSLKIYDVNLQNQVWEIISAAENSKPNGTQHPEPKPDPPHPPLPQQQLQIEEEQQKPSEKKNKRERKEERQKKNKMKKNGENGENNTDKQKMKKKKKKRKREAEGEEEEEEEQDEEEEPTSKPKKRKGEEPGKENQHLEDLEDQQDQQEEQSSSKGKFNWKGTIKTVLRQGPDEGLSVKKLRKKVLAAYYSFSGDGNYRSEEELYSMFNRKLSGPKFKVLKDKVRLVK